MKLRTRRRALPLALMAACFAIGLAAGWWLHATGGPKPVITGIPGSIDGASHDASTSVATQASPVPGDATTLDTPVATSGRPAVSSAPSGVEPGGAIEQLHRRHLRVPIDGLDVETLKGGFTERRSGSGGHTHEAVDILAPRNTPVHAVEDGTIAKLFLSKAGGITLYQFDPSQHFVYYYAHLERYADGLQEGQPVKAGDVLGYVGTSGNAPPGTPHLHFAISELGPDKRWWQADALDPYLVYRR